MIDSTEVLVFDGHFKHQNLHAAAEGRGACMVREREGKPAGVLTAANGLTVFRAVLSCLAGGLFVNGGADRVALWLCVTAVALDLADGWAARRWGQTTVVGTFMDPVADKIAMLVVYGTIALRVDSLGVWVLLGLGAVRDVWVTAQRIAGYKMGRGAFGPDRLGRFKTLVQSTAGIGVLFYAVYLRDGFPPSPRFVIGVMGVTVALSYVSWIRYAEKYGSRCGGGDRRIPGERMAGRDDAWEHGIEGGTIRKVMAKGSVADQDRPTLTTVKPNGMAGSN